MTERETWILGNRDSGITSTIENAKAVEPGFDMMTTGQQKELIEEVDGVLNSIYATHGSGNFKKKLLIRDTIADITLQQVSG